MRGPANSSVETGNYFHIYAIKGVAPAKVIKLAHNEILALWECLEEEAFVSEINEELLKIARGRQFLPEAVGYMLLGFFEGVCRHLACEREYLYELLEGDLKRARRDGALQRRKL